MSAIAGPTLDLGWSVSQSRGANSPTQSAGMVIRLLRNGHGWAPSSDEIDALSGLFNFGDYTEVSRFLASRADIRALLLQAFPRLVHIFGTTAQLNLQLLLDPEDESQLLVVLIATGMSIDESLDRLRSLDESWLRAASASIADMAVDVV
jgi:hypothetical protein